MGLGWAAGFALGCCVRRGLGGFARGSLGRGGERDAKCEFMTRRCPRVARRSERRRFTRGYMLGVPSGLAIVCGAWCACGVGMRGVGLWAPWCPRVARRSERRRFTRGYILGVPSGLAVGVGHGVRAALRWAAGCALGCCVSRGFGGFARGTLGRGREGMRSVGSWAWVSTGCATLRAALLHPWLHSGRPFGTGDCVWGLV